MFKYIKAIRMPEIMLSFFNILHRFDYINAIYQTSNILSTVGTLWTFQTNVNVVCPFDPSRFNATNSIIIYLLLKMDVSKMFIITFLQIRLGSSVAVAKFDVRAEDMSHLRQCRTWRYNYHQTSCHHLFPILCTFLFNLNPLLLVQWAV